MDPELETLDGSTTEENPVPPAEGGTAETARKTSVVDSLPPDTVEELCSLFGCTREALGVLLSSSAGDPAHIMSLVQTLSPSYLAIKLRFETRKKGELGGAACIIAEGRSGNIVDTTLWVSGRELPATFTINADWEAVRNGIQKIGNNPDRSLFPKVSKLLRDVFSPTAVNMLYTSPKAREEVVASLEKAFALVYHNEIVFELSTETFNKARLELGGLGEREEPAAATSAPEVSLAGAVGRVQINCKPLVDPVKGKPVSEILPGDLLAVEIEMTGGLSNVVGKILSKSGESPVFPVISVERLPSGQSLIRLAVSKGIEGVAKVSADLRLKTAPQFALAGAGGRLAGDLKRIVPGLVVVFGVFALLYYLLRG